MTPLRSAYFAVSLAAAVALLAGCSSTSSTIGNTAATATPAHASGTSAAASSSPSGTGSALPTSTASSVSTPVTTTGTAGGTGQPGAGRVYFAESGDVAGTVLYEPACQSGCELSGDGTTALFDMAWTTWNATEAVGSGTEKLDDCTPNCAAGTLHSVPVKATFTKPAKATCSGTTRLYWTSVRFVWPDGLPAAFSGQDAPLNPFTYSAIDCAAG